MAREWVDRFMGDPGVTTMPATMDGIIDSALQHPDYMSRADRERARDGAIRPGK